MTKADLVLRFVPEEMVAILQLDPSHVAFAIVTKEGRRGRLAGIISDRVERTADRLEFPVTLVLGHVIAHELGHLLLGQKGHSGAGIMSFPLDSRYLTKAARGDLGFFPSEGRRMRRLLRRSLQSEG
jgi:hypothetical protein